jgi:FMN reductase
MYRAQSVDRFVAEMRQADGIILASPAYHGGVSGLIKNAIDYVEDLRADSPPYFQGRAVGLIATAAGWQGAAFTLAAMRNIVHALRGWPTPIAVPINTLEPTFDAQGNCVLPKLREHLVEMARQVVEFALRQKMAMGSQMPADHATHC